MVGGPSFVKNIHYVMGMSKKSLTSHLPPNKMCCFFKVSVLVGFVDPLIFRQAQKLRLPEGIVFSLERPKTKTIACIYLTQPMANP